MSAVKVHQVDAAEDGMRLDRWFRAHFPDLPHGRLQKLLRTGQVRVEGGRVKANTRLATGQHVRVPPITTLPPKVNTGPQISSEDTEFIQSLVIHQDSEIIAINKPAGLAVQGGTKTARHVDGLLDGLRFGLKERPRLVHRLDKDTSGVLLLARSRSVAAALSQALKKRSVTKLYWALVIGVPRIPQGKINLALEKTGGHDGERVRVAGANSPEAQHAETRYKVVESAGQRLAWLAMMPETGRMHQLRVHAAAIDHPIVGDGKYGGAEAFPGGDISGRLHLHARAILVPRPKGDVLRVEAPLQDHMQSSWRLLGFDPNAAVDIQEFDEL